MTNEPFVTPTGDSDIPFDDDGDATTPTVDPMKLAADYVRLTRERKRLEAELSKVTDGYTDLETRRFVPGTKQLGQQLLDLVDNEQFPTRASVDGATVGLRSQIWASAARDGNDNPDHKTLTEALKAEGLVEYLPSTVSTQGISAYVREELKKAPVFDADGKPLSPQERAALVLPTRLVDALSVTEKRELRVTGA